MKIALAQMRMTGNVQENLEKSLKFCDLAEDCDLLFFPEIQLSPFFPQYEKQDAEMYVMEKNGQEIAELAGKAKEHQYYLSPNVYLTRISKNSPTSIGGEMNCYLLHSAIVGM